MPRIIIEKEGLEFFLDPTSTGNTLFNTFIILSVTEGWVSEDDFRRVYRPKLEGTGLDRRAGRQDIIRLATREYTTATGLSSKLYISPDIEQSDLNTSDLVTMLNLADTNGFVAEVIQYPAFCKIPDANYDDDLPALMPNRTYLDENEVEQTHTWRSWAGRVIEGTGDTKLVPFDAGNPQGLNIAATRLLDLNSLPGLVVRPMTAWGNHVDAPSE